MEFIRERKEDYSENPMKTEIMLGFFQHLMFDKYSNIHTLEPGCTTQNHPSFTNEITQLTVKRQWKQTFRNHSMSHTVAKASRAAAVLL